MDSADRHGPIAIDRPHLNRAWHMTHKMPPNPTLEQRLHWHLQHSANCGCRTIPPALLAELARRGIILVSPRSLK